VEANRAAIAAKGLDLTIDVPDAVLDVDPTRFVQVISNLLHNATKFTDAGGSIRVSGEVTVAEPAAGPQLRLSIADSGIGIPAEFQPKVFELFSQGARNSSEPGLGIGLALARRLVEMHGGGIEVHSQGAGHGSEFVIRIPVGEGQPRLDSDESIVFRKVDCRVTVIDDNTDAAATIAMLVEQLGGACSTAHDGETGLQAIREHRPGVVLLDIGMPGLNGYETCRRIRQEFGDEIIVVALTGFGQDQDKEAAINAGFSGHLTKPADPAALLELLQKASPRG
jgi:CheY-like chemotaxis protein